MRHLLLAFSSVLVAGCYAPDLGDVGFYCHKPSLGDPECPDGEQCLPYKNPANGANELRCQRGGFSGSTDMAGGLIPKMGPPYGGLHSDPGLNDVMTCPDVTLEPNDAPETALDAPTPTPDLPTPKVTKMAICPKGLRADTGNHDVDYFHVSTTGFTQSTLNMKVELFYDITFGDLDVGLFDQTGNLLASDGTSATNACITKSVPQGDYFVVVVGANNTDVNKYDIRIRTFTAPQTCPLVPQDGGI